jgi:hypothetical protein
MPKMVQKQSFNVADYLLNVGELSAVTKFLAQIMCCVSVASTIHDY